MVALFPDEKESAFVVDVLNKKWWPSNAFVPIASKLWRKRLSDLCHFYKDDYSFEQKELCELSNAEKL